MDLQEREWFIEAPWGRICIVAWGNCLDPPVLVCHGERDSLASYRPLIRLLPTNLYYVGMELPGNGKSDPYPAGLPLSLLDFVHTVELVRRHFRWDQFMFMGHSVATIIGRFYNIIHPGRLSRVVELDQITICLTIPMDKFALWFDRAYTQYFDKYSVYTSPLESAPKYTWEQIVERVVAVRGISKECARATLQRWTAPAGDGLVRLTVDQRMKSLVLPPYSPAQIKELYTSITTPTLAIVASDSVEKNLFKYTPYLLENTDNYRVFKANGNHDVHVISPEQFADKIGQFLLYGLDGVSKNKSKL